MADSSTQLRSVTSAPEDGDHMRAELEALRYENAKLKTINSVLMQRVELGWGNFSTAYSAFQKAAMLTEKVATKALKLQQTQSRLDEATLDLTRTRLEKEVTHQRLSDLLESVSDAIVLFDQNRRLVVANSHFYEFWSGTGATIVAGETKLTDLVPMSIRYGIFEPRMSPPERTAHAPGGGKDSVFRLKNGRWLQMSERPTSDGGLAVVYTDITRVKEDEIRERERALDAKTDVLKSTLDNLPQGVSLVGPDNRLEAWNHRFVELTGVDPSAVHAGVDISDLMRGSEVGEEVEDLRELLCDCDPESGLCEREKALSNGIVLDIRSHPVLGGGFVVTYTDITERSRNAAALRESERRLRLITDAMPALISYINSERRYEFANKTFEEWFDRPSSEIEGQYLWQVLGDSEYRNHEPYIARALAGDVVNFELEQQLPGARKRISYKTYVPHYGDDEVIGFFALEQDVTEKRRTAQALKHAYQHMEQRVFERTRELTELNQTLQREIAERALIEDSLLKATREAELASESKVKFIAAAGHDLLQPLNAARLFSAALQERRLPEGASDLAASLARSLDDVESIITTLVDISKLEAGVVEPVTEAFVVDELLAALAAEFSALAEQRGLQFRYERCTMVVDSDSQLLARILRNFLTNALRYTDHGKILLGCRRRPEGLDIEVADTGVGISADQLEIIFEEFQRLDGSDKRDSRGLGLGLAIVDKLSRVLGCEVFVRSLPSRGSVFTVRVPYGRLARRELELPHPLPVADSLDGRRILVIDNEADICRGMEDVLGGWGCDVRSAQTVGQLAVLLHDMEEAPDVAIVDYQLDGDVTGFDAVRQIDAALGYSLPVIMITANYTKALREEVTGSGYHLLNKPVKPLKLRLLLTRLLQEAVAA
mgnify:FL=1